jgi:hypothetical protein
MDQVSRALLSVAGGVVGQPTDPLFNQVGLLLVPEGSSGGNNNSAFDASGNNLTVTRAGNATTGTFHPFGNRWSNYFDGTGDYLSLPGPALGSGNFTIEAWVCFTSLPNSLNAIYSNGLNDSTGAIAAVVYVNSAGNLGFYNYPVATTTSSTVPLGRWTHVAIVRNSGTIALYINGVSGATVANSSNISDAAVQVMRGFGGVTDSPTGYMSNLRVVVGTAVYTANFTPPTAPLTAIANTALLTCQSNRFRDASSNNFTVTRNGDVSVQRFSPFAYDEPYAFTEGGSAYFDGLGDYLSVASSTALDFGTGNFTVEFWANFSELTSNRVLIDRYDSTNGNSWQIYWRSTGSSITFYAGGAVVLQDPSATSIVPKTWNHIAVTRSGTTARMFINGALVASATNSTTLTNGLPLVVGVQRETLTNYFNGFISNVRILTGTAQYTANFTPPALPLTAITNTRLLLLTNDAPIVDFSRNHVIETAGNSGGPALSTNNDGKFGGGAIDFDSFGRILRLPGDGSPLNFGAGDFTIEAWHRPTSVTAGAATGGIFATTDGTNHGVQFDITAGKLRIRLTSASAGTFVTMSSTNNVAAWPNWSHLAVTRSGGTVRLFINGVLEGTATGVTGTVRPTSSTIRPIVGSTAPASIGSSSLNHLDGDLDDLRVTLGVARYVAAFTPPIASFPRK